MSVMNTLSRIKGYEMYGFTRVEQSTTFVCLVKELDENKRLYLRSIFDVNSSK